MTKGLCKNVFDNFKAKLYSVFGIKTLQGFETLEELCRNSKFNLVLKILFFIFQPYYTTPSNIKITHGFSHSLSFRQNLSLKRGMAKAVKNQQLTSALKGGVSHYSPLGILFFR